MSAFIHHTRIVNMPKPLMGQKYIVFSGLQGSLNDKMYSYDMLSDSFLNEIAVALERMSDDRHNLFNVTKKKEDLDKFVEMYNVVKAIESKSTCKINVCDLDEDCLKEIDRIATDYAEHAEMPHERYYYESISNMIRDEVR